MTSIWTQYVIYMLIYLIKMSIFCVILYAYNLYSVHNFVVVNCIRIYTILIIVNHLRPKHIENNHLLSTKSITIELYFRLLICFLNRRKSIKKSIMVRLSREIDILFHSYPIYQLSYQNNESKRRC